MSRNFLTSINLNQLELLNARIQNLASAPGTPVVGQIYFDTVLNKFRVYAGAPITNWVNLDGSDIPDSAITSAKILDGAIMNIDINASAAIALTKLATDPLARANHTGTQLASTISDFGSAALEISQDAVGAIIGAGGIVASYDDAGTGLTTLTFTNNEAMQDVIGAFLPSGAGSTGITVTYDDAGGKINYVVTDSPLLNAQNGAYYLARTNHTGTQAPVTILFAATDKLLGRDTASGGTGEEIGVTGGIVFDGSGNIQTTAFTGDVTKALGGTALTIGANKVLTSMILDANVTNAKLANMTNATFKARSTAGTGVPEDITASQAKSILAIVPGDVTGFDTQVRTNRLDQMANPTASVSLNSQLITNLLDPSNPQDAATKNYVDLARQGITLKGAVKAASTGPLTLSGTQTVDGVALIATDRVLVKDQAAHQNDGIYVVAAGAWTRATDADTAAEINDGATVFVQQGSTNANFTYTQVNTITTLGTDVQSWVQQGAATAYLGGNGIDLTGLTFDVVAGNGIIADGTSTRVDPAVVARKYNATVGDGAALSYVKNHGLGNQWVTAQVFRNSAPFDLIDCDVELTDANNVTLRFVVAPTTAQHRLVVTG